MKKLLIGATALVVFALAVFGANYDNAFTTNKGPNFTMAGNLYMAGHDLGATTSRVATLWATNMDAVGTLFVAGQVTFANVGPLNLLMSDSSSRVKPVTPAPEGYVLVVSNGIPTYVTNVSQLSVTNLTSITNNVSVLNVTQSIKVNGKAATVFSVNGTEMPIANIQDSSSVAFDLSGTNASARILGVTTTNLTWNTETLSPSGGTNFVVDLLSPRTALITATADVNFLNSTNRTASTATERNKKVRILASGANRLVTLHSSWLLVGSTTRTFTVTNGTWLVMALDNSGPSETNVFAGATYAQ